MRYKAVIFDFDYTLGDSTGPIVTAAQGALKEMGWPPAEREAIRRTIGHTLQDAYTMLTGDRDPEQKERFYHTFRAIAKETMVRDTVLLPGTEEILRRLSGQGVKLAVVSTKGRHNIAEIFHRFALEELFSCIVGFENVSAPKPDPEGLLYALGQVGVRPEEALYVGDTVIDAETALRAGTAFAAVTTGTTEAEAFAAFPSKTIVSCLNALSAWLERTGT
jgi:HAD superfamily hydrolase (TIGR01549 family)